MRINQDIITFFEKQDTVIVSTIDPTGCIHCSVKGIVGIKKSTKIFLVDLYFYHTFANLKKNPTISITAVDERLFKGYTLQGQAKIISRDKIHEKVFQEWENRVVRRISKRVVDSVKLGLKSKEHHEAQLPIHPRYLIEITVKNIVDLAPPRPRTRGISCETN
jgi:hypothetical protein